MDVPYNYKNKEGYADLVILANHRDIEGLIKKMLFFNIPLTEVEKSLHQFAGCELNTIELKGMLIELGDELFYKLRRYL